MGRDPQRRLVSEGEELDVLLEPVRHRELVGELVVALDRLAVGRLAGDRGLDARLGDVLADAPLLPLGVAGAEPLLAEALLLVGGHLVVRHRDRCATAAVLLVQAHHGVGGRAGASEEVDDRRLGLVFHEEAKSVLDGVQRLREREIVDREMKLSRAVRFLPVSALCDAYVPNALRDDTLRRLVGSDHRTVIVATSHFDVACLDRGNRSAGRYCIGHSALGL